LYGIEGVAQDAGERQAVLLIVDVHAVERNVRLVAAAAVDGAVAAVPKASVEGGGAHEGHSRLQREQTRGVAAFER